MGLSFWDCFIVILVVNLVTDLIPAWTSVFGLTGLRMTTFRYVEINPYHFSPKGGGHGLIFHTR